jgi:GTP-binding protein LepA
MEGRGCSAIMRAMQTDRIRNFSIIAHIDHGKSTLADRLLLKTGRVTERQFRVQMLDDMDIERERGITIKASAVALEYIRPDGTWLLNLIDTPGHVDFTYEVSRSLKACEGAVLLVDATQGVEAQTVANAFLAIEFGVEIIPVVNKVDLATARVDDTLDQIVSLLGCRREDILQVSAKTGEGVPALLDAIIERVPAPIGDPAKTLRALVFDSHYDDYRGVVVYVRVIDGTLKAGEKVKMIRTGGIHTVDEVGRYEPSAMPVKLLSAGEVGYILASIKDIREVNVGDTVTAAGAEGVEPLPGYKEPKPMVFCGLYPDNETDFSALREALDRLALNDSSFQYQPITSAAMGFGFHCGFLGLLHMEIIQERLLREHNIAAVQTAPTVTYEVETTDGKVVYVNNPSDMPDQTRVKTLREPVVRTQFILPATDIGAVTRLAQERRGHFVRTEYLSATRVILVYDMPLAEIVYDFFDLLKGATRGFGSMDYEFKAFQESDLVRMEILVNGEPVDALSTIVHREESQRRGRKYLSVLRKEIPRHMFQIPLQAAIGGKIIARENISAMAKNVTAKCYGGDVTRKRKLLEKQKKGKKRMRTIGRVDVPQSAFLAVLQARKDD